jgi:hypothetical protein
MPTFVYSKEDFIKWIDKEVSQNQVIVFTNELTGNLSHSTKTGIKITHQYAETVFKDEGIGHIAFGKTHPLGLLIANKDRLSDIGAKVVEEANK